MTFYTGQFEPMVPTPAQRGVAYVVDSLLVLVVFGLVPGILLGGLSRPLVAGFLVAHAAYYIMPTVLFGGTLAKLLSGLRVTMADGSRVRPDAAILRYLVFSLTVFYVPFGVILTFVFLQTSAERLALHDRIAKTIVRYRE